MIEGGTWSKIRGGGAGKREPVGKLGEIWKTTSLNKKMELESMSNNFYPLTPLGYPRNTQALALWSNLVLFPERVEAKQRQPRTLRWVQEGTLCRRNS